MPDDITRVLAMWALMHEVADDAWKAVVAKGKGNPEADETLESLYGLAVAVDDEKARLREALSSGTPISLAGSSSEKLEFELAEIRGRLEAIETAIDALGRRLGEA